MKKRLFGGLVLGLGMGLFCFGQQVNAKEMQRLYNPNSGEHFYTDKILERDTLVIAGWQYEGIGWGAPDQGNPVYRLYNPNAGDHHYTVNPAEKNLLVSKGWRYEGIGWYSDSQNTIPLYRAYNPNAKAGSHNYTTGLGEQNSLVKLGWKNEGIGWYAKTAGYSKKLLNNVEEAAIFMGRRFIQSGGAEAFQNGRKNANGSFTFDYQLHGGFDGVTWNRVIVSNSGKILSDEFLKLVPNEINDAVYNDNKINPKKVSISQREAAQLAIDRHNKLGRMSSTIAEIRTTMDGYYFEYLSDDYSTLYKYFVSISGNVKS